jgi:hypothetical protein
MPFPREYAVSIGVYEDEVTLGRVSRLVLF